MEGLDLGQTSNPSLAWKMDVLKINDDDDEFHIKPFEELYSRWPCSEQSDELYSQLSAIKTFTRIKRD